MRQALTVVALSFVVGCVGSEPKGCVGSEPKPCTGTRTDNGDGTTTIVCTDGTKDLVCTHPDCSGIASLSILETDLTRVIIPALATIDYLDISGNTALSTLDLSALTSVSSNLQIAANTTLTTLDLSALTSGAWINISANGCLATISLPALTSVRALEIGGSSGLMSLDLPTLVVAGYLGISDNAALSNVNLPALTLVETSLDVSNNASLTRLELPSLTTAPGARGCSEMGCGGGMYVSGNSGLAHLGLPALTDAGSLEISANPVLTSIDLSSLAGISSTGGWWGGAGLDVSGNSALANLSLPALTHAGSVDVSNNLVLAKMSLPALTKVDGYLNIKDNPALSSCQAVAILGRLRDAGYAGRALISGNDLSETCPPGRFCAGLAVDGGGDWAALISSSCEEVAGDLTVRALDLASLSGAAIKRIDGNLDISGNQLLVDASLPELAVLDGQLTISDNPILASLALPSLERTGGVDVSRNPALLSLSLPVLASSGSLTVSANAAMSEVSAPVLSGYCELRIVANSVLTAVSLPRLSSLWGLYIDDNAALPSVALPALYFAQWFSISGNAALASLDFPALTTVTITLYVHDNPTLPQCQVNAVFARLVGFGGLVNISGNNTTATCP